MFFINHIILLLNFRNFEIAILYIAICYKANRGMKCHRLSIKSPNSWKISMRSSKHNRSTQLIKDEIVGVRELSSSSRSISFQPTSNPFPFVSPSGLSIFALAAIDLPTFIQRLRVFRRKFANDKKRG